jgi:16S rRNA (uracil1498-N3)-methyltransferase
VLRLSSDEAHYVARVCRARPGDIVEATDGRGALARLRLTSVGAAASAEVVAVERIERIERQRRAWLWCGAPERGRADWLVEKLAELGVERFQPLECESGSWPAGAARGERWQRLAVAAMRQSRRAFLLEIRDPITVEEAIATMERPAFCRVGDPEGLPAVIGVGPGGPAAGPAALEIGAIGPSAGFSPAERERLAAAGFVPTRLSDARLRTETAAICLASSWAAVASGPPGARAIEAPRG